MRGESRSRSRSPNGSNDYKGDRGVNNDTPPCNKVYVTFLPEDIQENQLKDLFEECGSVCKLFLKKKQDGFTFAHIQYQSVDEAKRAIESLNKRKIGGKNIRVQFSRQNPRDNNQRGDSRDRNDRSGDRNGGGHRGGRGGDHGRESDTRKRFQNEGGGFQSRGRGRGRGGGFRQGGRDGGRDGGQRNFGGRNEGGRGGERGPMKCFKCQGEGHQSKNCPNGDGGDQRKSDFKNSKPPKVDKMSEDQDY